MDAGRIERELKIWAEVRRAKAIPVASICTDLWWDSIYTSLSHGRL